MKKTRFSSIKSIMVAAALCAGLALGMLANVGGPVSEEQIVAEAWPGWGLGNY
ncbi:MAG: hypothetical protein RR139_01265 [Lachnospiraceae bacterium]